MSPSLDVVIGISQHGENPIELRVPERSIDHVDSAFLVMADVQIEHRCRFIDENKAVAGEFPHQGSAATNIRYSSFWSVQFEDLFQENLRGGSEVSARRVKLIIVIFCPDHFIGCLFRNFG